MKKTKIALAVIGLVFSQTFLNSCNQDSVDMQTETVASKSSDISVSNLDGQNYFDNPDIFNQGVNFIKAKVAQNGPGYVLTQNDLNEFYQITQIPDADRLPLDTVNQLIGQTTAYSQLTFYEALTNLGYSNPAKDLAVAISNSYMPDLENKLAINNLPQNEKEFLRNLNKYRLNYEQGAIIGGGVMSKDGGGFIGGAIGLGIGFAVAGPPGAFIGGTIGWFVGVALDNK
ncbi:hypothetical protein [Chryseobacterium sp. MMS23-Vi53]|uniref:hypothetical protein n=1 Tax=Chryseobacterium sp. MMS23-Vi53 TaxID=3386644 RepID=UPI0039E9CFD5